MRTRKTRPGLKRLTAIALVIAMLLTVMPASVSAKPGPKTGGSPSSPFAWLFQSLFTKPAAAPAPEAPAAEPEAPTEEPVEEPAAEQPAEEPAPEAPAEEPVAPAEEPAPEAPAEEPSPIVAEELKVDDLTVSIEAEAGAFPEGTAVTAEKADLADVQKAVDDAEGVSGQVLYAVDITFTNDGQELQPAEGKTVKVSFSADDLKAVADNAAVVHIDSETQEAEKVDTVESEDADVAIEAKEFSVYAVIGTPEDENLRVKIVFKNAGLSGEDIEFYLKAEDLPTQTDPDDHTEQIIYDPGVPVLEDANTIFAGWTTDANYTSADIDDGMDIDEVRDLARAAVLDGVEVGETLTLYPMIFTVYRVFFQDENGVTFDTDTYYVTPGSDKEITINKSYTVTDPTMGLVGWQEIGEDQQPVGNPIKNGSTKTINGDLVLKAKVDVGHWLSFDENDAGTGGSFTPPKFYAAGETTEEPADPTRPGYDFVAWHEGDRPDPYGSAPTGDVYQFNQELVEDTVLYAEWLPRTEASYKIVVWLQSVKDSVDATVKTYDYFKDEVIEGVAPGTQVSQDKITEYTTKDQYSNLTEYEAYLAYFDAQNAEGKSPSTIKNRPYKYSRYEITNGVGEQGDCVSGRNDTVVNVYYDREVYVVAHVDEASFEGATKMPSNIVYEYKGQPGTPSTGHSYYGVENGSYILINARRISTGIYEYTKANGDTYRGPIFDAYRSNYNTYYVRVQTGLYGQSVDWPKAPSGNRWINVSYVDAFDGNLFGYASSGNQANVITTKSTDADDLQLHYWFEDVPQSYDATEKTYTEKATIQYSNATQFNVTSRFQAGTITGYNGDSNSADEPTSWTEKTDSGMVPISGNHLHVKYDLVRNNIKFVYEGVTLDDYEIVDVPYGYPLNEFEALAPTSDAQAIKDLIPDPNGYYFAGWYKDPLFTEEMDWSDTMPQANLSVYAKIAEKEYRFHADLSDGTTLPNDQWNSFVVPYRTKIEGVNFENAIPPSGMTDVSLVGWFITDEEGNIDFSRPYNFDMIQITDNELSLSYAEHPEARDDFYDEHDPNHEDNDLDNPDVQGVVWIKPVWRDNTILQSGGIHVRYQLADGTLYENDSLTYADMAEVYAMQAPAKELLPTGKHFKNWQLVDGNRNDSVEVYPSETFYVTKPSGTASAGEKKVVNSVDENGELWVTFKAILEDDEKETPTHIDWYSNIQSVSGDTLDQNDFTKPDGAVSTDYGWVISDNNLQINENVAIPAFDTYTYPGYEFLGWGKASSDSPTSFTINNDVWLKWVPANGDVAAHYEAQDNQDAWVPVEYVAADEIEPYDNLFALWQKRETFTVVYSSDLGTEYTFYCDEAPETINLVAGTAGLTDVDGSAATLGVTDGRLYAGYYTAAPVNGKWDVASAGTADGRTLAPQPNTTYYVKEVDASYLSGYCTYSYVGTANAYKNQCTSMVFLSSIDDLNYSGVGFVLNKDDQLTNKTSGVRKSIKFQPAGKTAVTINASTAFGHPGYLTYLDVGTILDFADLISESTDENDELTVTFSSANFQLYPYWVTLDGVPVVGTGSDVVIHVLENGVVIKPANRANITDGVPANVMAVLEPAGN